MAKKILIIEDDASLAENLEKTIKAAGFEVYVCHDGETGFKFIQEKIPDLILLDLVLPKKHGFKIMEEMAKSPELKNIQVIVLTNLESPNDIEQASSLGIKAYLVKANYTPSEILKKVQEALQG
ncbi:response regulator [Candidatus Giovannonibacteria bacterium]|nr:response regulator [Candidatus Giovannonibacteria bacterium]